MYVDLLPLINSRRIELLDHGKTISQLCGLERRTARSGKDSIDHSPGGHDDLANVIAGAAALCNKFGGYTLEPFASDYRDPDAAPPPESSANQKLGNLYKSLATLGGPSDPAPPPPQWPRQSTNVWPW